MKICTWNVNSLKARLDYVIAFLDEVQPDVLGLQELKLETADLYREAFEGRGYHLAVHGQKQWNGVLIASKAPLEDVHCGLPDGDEGQARLVAATVNGVRFINLYCPQGQAADSPKFEYKLAFFDALCRFLSEEHDPTQALVLMGDINIAPGPDDVYDVEKMTGVPTYHPLEHQRWERLINWGLVDVVKPHLEPNTYSFFDYRGMAFRFNQGFRIDHILATKALVPRFTSAWVDRPWRKKRGDLKPSDHVPVLAELSGA